MKREEHYAGEWDGVCGRCGHNYFKCRGNCTCLACNAQRQEEVGQGLFFDGDDPDEYAEGRTILLHTFGVGDVVKIIAARRKTGNVYVRREGREYWIIARDPTRVERDSHDNRLMGGWFCLPVPDHPGESESLYFQDNFIAVDNWIEKARAMLGISQTELAEKTGISQPQISRYENDQWPGRDNMLKIAGVLKLKLDDVLGPEE